MNTIWESADDVLDYAINAEEQAMALYTEMAKQAKSSKTRDLLTGLAG